ncbi:leucine zipper domain-containing protein [Inmirania thermothiophila]|uniref:leucine zipper domain-containing protein n=1 Tax=Inmirania thermothiophila TaxID=1750597 RepID=UPI000F4AC185
MVDEGRPGRVTAGACGVGPRTPCKRLRGFREEGPAGLVHRSLRPRRCPHPTDPALIRRAIALRRQRLGSRHAQNSASPGSPRHASSPAQASVASAIAPPHRPRGVRSAPPGLLPHLDIKKPGRLRRPGHRVTAACRHNPRALVGRMSTSPSTTVRASASPPSRPIRRHTVLVAS